MLIDIKLQVKTGTIILTAPDGTIYPFNGDVKSDEDRAKMCQSLGKAIVGVLSDPEQPAQTQTAAYPGNTGSISGDLGVTEENLREGLNQIHPALGKVFEWMTTLPEDERG